MSSKTLIMLGAIAALTASASETVLAKESASFRISGIVHTVCRMEFFEPGASQGNGAIELGSFTQLCNAKSGYRITMTHPAQMGGATLLVDGQSIPLSNGNETVIIDEGHPAFKVSSAQLNLHGIDFPTNSLSFRIEPKGAIF